MENTDQTIQQEVSTVTDATSTDDIVNVNDQQCANEEALTNSNINNEQPISGEAITNDEQHVIENTSTNAVVDMPTVEHSEQQIVEEKPIAENDQQEIAKATNEQENSIDSNAVPVASSSVSPARTNLPFKEVNEGGQEDTNGATCSINRKRELEQDDKTDATNDNDERSDDQTKKIKISEATDIPNIELKETETNIVLNGHTAVEV